MDCLKTFLVEHINITEQNFMFAVGYSFLCFLSWIILPELQFRYKLLSKLTAGDQGIACDFLAYFLIYTGTLRNKAINDAIASSGSLNYGIFEIPVLAISYIMFLFGLMLVAMSFYRLGMRGMYFGDHFGFLFKEKITQFPYNYFPNAQYVGTTSSLIGYSLAQHSLVGILIAFIIYILYEILNIVEFRKLKIFYPPKDVKVN
jgi:phosphatidylethanolamine N-methyltransferase